MKICHVTTVHPYNDNRIFFKEIISLKENDFDVCLLALAENDFVYEGVKVIALTKTISRFKRFFKVSIIEVYKKAIKEVKADVYHFHDPELMLVALILKVKGKRVVFDVHENNPAALLSKPYLKNLILKHFIAKSMDLAEKFFFSFYDKIITARPDISERLIKHNPITLRNFPILPDLSNTIAKVVPNKFSLIYVGVISEIRGILPLIDAFENLDAELWLLGPFENEALKLKCESNKNWNKVKYFGTVEPYEIFEYVKSANAGIITFLPYPNHVTTLATKPFEYMACGLPVVMSDFDYWKDFFEDNAIYVNPTSKDSIAEGIKYLISNPELTKKMGEKNYQLATNEYNWQSESQKLISMYNSFQ